MYGLFNYIYAVARVNKIKNIIIDEKTYDKLEKDFSLKEKYELQILENNNAIVHVKELYKE